MQIAHSERVTYTNNPLVEVILQVRFGRVLSLEQGPPVNFQHEFADTHYPKSSAETVQLAFSTQVDGGVAVESSPAEVGRVFHFVTLDGSWKVSVCADFLSLTCSAYTRWEEFRARALEAFDAFRCLYPSIVPTRLGLRYKDVIERRPLGLEGTPWRDLLEPFVIGVLSSTTLTVGGDVPDDMVGTLVSHAALKLDSCSLTLQTAQLKAMSGNERAFMIDSDFFSEPPVGQAETASIFEQFDVLHHSAGALFRRCIKEKLHVALGPSATSPT